MKIDKIIIIRYSLKLTCLYLVNICNIFLNSVLDLGLISIASLGPRASTKVESHVNFTESQKV